MSGSVPGRNFLGGNFLGENSPGGILIGGNFPSRSFPDTSNIIVFLNFSLMKMFIFNLLISIYYQI